MVQNLVFSWSTKLESKLIHFEQSLLGVFNRSLSVKLGDFPRFLSALPSNKVVNTYTLFDAPSHDMCGYVWVECALRMRSVVWHLYDG